VLRPAERLAAQRALERTLARVDPRVPCKVSDAREPLVADGAGERSLTRVTPVVYDESRRAGETLAALGTEVFHLDGAERRQRRLRRVGSLVATKPALRHEPFAACLALVRFDAAVRLGVDDEVGAAGETLLARRAHVRPWLAVGVGRAVRHVVLTELA